MGTERIHQLTLVGLTVLIAGRQIRKLNTAGRLTVVTTDGAQPVPTD